MSDKQIFEANADPMAIAVSLGLKIVQWLDGVLYARDDNELYAIGPIRHVADGTGPADLRIGVEKDRSLDWQYVGEIYHSPAEGATHAGLTIIERDDMFERVTALDGFGRKYSVSKTGNGPIASFDGWATHEEMLKWAPKHNPVRRTET